MNLATANIDGVQYISGWAASWVLAQRQNAARVHAITPASVRRLMVSDLRQVWSTLNMRKGKYLKGLTRAEAVAGGPAASRHRAVAKVFPLYMTISCGAMSVCAQLPSIVPGGIVNAASYLQPVSPGSVISIFGSNLADGEYRALTTPLPPTLGGASVSVNGTPAPLFYVSPTQINAQITISLAYSLDTYIPAAVVVTTKIGASAAEPVSVFNEGPAIYDGRQWLRSGRRPERRYGRQFDAELRIQQRHSGLRHDQRR
jgi:hypothetical protein